MGEMESERTLGRGRLVMVGAGVWVGWLEVLAKGGLWEGWGGEWGWGLKRKRVGGKGGRGFV